MQIHSLIKDTRNEFLELFEAKFRSTLANKFLKPIRNGITIPEKVISEVSKYCMRRERAEWLKTIRRNYQQAKDYVSYLLDWEQLTPDEKEQIRKARSTEYVKEAMKEQSATVKQVEYLRILGYKGAVPGSKLEACELIDSLKKQRGWL